MTEAEWWSSNDPSAMFDCMCNRKCWGNTAESMASLELKMESIDRILFLAGYPLMGEPRRLAHPFKYEIHSAAARMASDLLREIVGNPFRRVTMRYSGAFLPHGERPSFDAVFRGDHRPRWAKDCRNAWMQAYHMASVIYHEQAFDDFPILADALEDANCRADEENTVPILEHLRAGESHIRECWALGLILDLNPR